MRLHSSLPIFELCQTLSFPAIRLHFVLKLRAQAEVQLFASHVIVQDARWQRALGFVQAQLLGARTTTGCL